MTRVRHPCLYQVNTRVALNTLARASGRPATLDDFPDAELDRLAGLGFDWVWLLGVWQTGAAGRQVSRTQPQWQAEFRETLPDLTAADICGSCFAVTAYRVAADIGGAAALPRLRARMRQRGLCLMLDFVPNHLALDHPWARDHPEFFVRGTEDDLAQQPRNYTRVTTSEGSLVLAHGRDPYFPGWPDTLQLDYANPALQEAMRRELLAIAALCDGVRCDMAMLIEPEVFARTWGRRPAPFWPDAIAQVQATCPDFTFLAEVYWDMEWQLQQQGFDYTYDKRLYDRLRDGRAGPLRDHLAAGLDFQERLARFLENHDEPRAAAIFAPEVHRAAAIVTYFSPGLRFFHQGQLEGRHKRIPPHLCRGPDEPCDEEIHAFYGELLRWLAHPVLRDGDWRQLDCVPAEGGAGGFIAGVWRGRGQGEDKTMVLVVVNYEGRRAGGRVRLPFEHLRGGRYRLVAWAGNGMEYRLGESLLDTGLDLALAAWGYAILEVREVAPAA